MTPFVALISVLVSAPPITRARTERTRSSAGVKPILQTRSVPQTAARVLPKAMPAATPRVAPLVALARNAAVVTAGQ